MKQKNVSKRISEEMYRIAIFLELIVGIFIVLAILINLVYVVSDMKVMFLGGKLSFQQIMDKIMMLIIGIEFLKMLCRHNVESAIEVLLFAIARQMIIEHTTPFDNLLGVAAIAVLFAVRKYLVIKELDEEDKTYDTGKEGTLK